MSNTAPPSFLEGNARHALVLHGGGALGAYQAGVYEELVNTRYEPDWVVGVSIGAINGALIVGNQPDRRIARLREFWDLVSSGMGPFRDFFSETFSVLGFEPPAAMKQPRGAFNELSSMWSALAGIPGFFKPRFPPPMLQPDRTPGALSLYELAPLRETLVQLVDFDLINTKQVRFSAGAVNVRTGNSAYFDNMTHTITPDHILASCALPPAFPPITIDGEAYWDGGLVSNTPLQYVLDAHAPEKLCIFQVDLYSARGDMPANLAGANQRRKEILYSSRTRYNSDMIAKIVNTREKMRTLLDQLLDGREDNAVVRELKDLMRVVPIDIVQLIYRQDLDEFKSKESEFSRASVLGHWKTGRRDAHDTFTHPEWLKSSGLDDGVTLHELTRNAETA